MNLDGGALKCLEEISREAERRFDQDIHVLQYAADVLRTEEDNDEDTGT